MTVANNYAPIRQIGNGATTQFSAAWSMISAAYAFVQLEDSTTGVRTTVNQGVAANQYQIAITSSGFTVTMGTAPLSTQYLNVSRITGLDQTDSYRTSKGFQGEVEENSFDKLTAMVQDAAYKAGLAITIPTGEATTTVLPSASNRANKFLGFDSSGNVTVSNLVTTGTLYANVVSTAPAVVDNNVFLQGTYSVNSYLQEILQNTSSGAAASTDYVVNNNLGTATTFYGNFGMNSSGYTGSGSFNKANAVYLSSTSGDLVIGSTTANATHFVYNNSTTDSALIDAQGFTSPNLPIFSNGFNNKFRNATMDIWQRGTSGTVAGSTATTADGWIVGNAGANVSWARSSGRSGGLTTYSLEIIGLASVSDAFVKQRIESVIAALNMNATTAQMTFQAYVFNSTGASITPTLTVNHANAVDNFSAVTTDVSAVALQACPNAAWTKVSYTFAANAGSSNGLEVILDFGAALNSNAKLVLLSEFDLRVTPSAPTGLQSNPPAPELRPAAIEQILCQRYYQLLEGVPAAVNATTQINAYCPLPVVMRANPTVTVSAAINYQLAGSNQNQSAASAGSTNGTNYYLYQSSIPNFTGLTVGWAGICAIPSNGGVFNLTAEL